MAQKSTVYCSNCHENRTFVDDFASARQMVVFVRDKLKEQGHGFFKRWFDTSHISQTGRWKKLF